MRHSLEKDPLPSPAMKAYEGVARSVVRVVGLMDEEDDAKERPDKRAMDRSLGTGVVVKDDGTILTNLHVVWGAKRVRVTFDNGHGVGCDDGRRAARERPGGAQGRQACPTTWNRPPCAPPATWPRATR